MLNLAPESDEHELALDRRHLIHSLHSGAQPESAHVWVAGHGAVLVGQSGREFVDALAGLWNVFVGHGRNELAAAAAEQMTQLAFATSYSGSSNRPSIRLAERIVQVAAESIDAVLGR